jgi:hypothetical protein
VKSRIALLAALVALVAFVAPAAVGKNLLGASRGNSSQFPSARAEAKRPRQATPAQMRIAVGRAERSSDLWATVNICDTKRHPNTIGVRGQMPTLGFPARLEMTIKLRYWSSAKARFLPIPHVQLAVSLGVATTGLHQGGATFKFKPPVILSGEIDFRWLVGKKVLGRAVRLTRHGLKGVDQGDPPRYSTATCTMN